MSDSASYQLLQNSDLSNPNLPAAEDNDEEPSQKSPIHKTLDNSVKQEAPPDEQGEQQQQQQLEKQQQQDCEEVEQADQDDEEDMEDEEGMNKAQSSSCKNSKNRRNKKRKKGFSTVSNNAKQRKIQALTQEFKPIPFVPDKRFNFSKHEDNLRKLGLWDFANLHFDTDFRAGLLVQLVADYSPKGRVSYVNECRIKVSRADLARALKLSVKVPGKKLQFDVEGHSYSAEFISFLDEFVSSWMILQKDDVWVTPNEIVNWTKMISDGEPQRVDWAGLIWFMVEKELAQGTKLEDCYYASHLQLLIKDQRGNLLAENDKDVDEVMVEDDGEERDDSHMLNVPESSLGEEEERLSLNPCIELDLDKKPDDEIVQKGGHDDDDADADIGIERADDSNVVEVEGEATKSEEIVEDIDKEKNESNVVSMECLSEGEEMENNENVNCDENVNNTSGGMSVDDMVHFGSERNWLNGVNDEARHVMQRCSNMSSLNMPAEDDAGCQDVEDEVGEGDEQGFNFMEENTPAMNEMSSRNLLQAIETGHLPYSSVEHGGQSSLGFLPSKDENDVMLDGTSLFDHVVKREIDQEHEISHHALNENHKRIRFDGQWDHKPPDSGTCVDEIMQWAQKLKMVQETEREDLYQQVNMAQMYAQGKENEVMQYRCKFEELQRKFHAEVGRRDRELHLMNNVIDGYRRALKDSQKAFSEYRKRCQIPDEPIYKDVGSGGVVKSIMEVERERIKQEAENRYLVKQTYNERMDYFETKFQVYLDKVRFLDERLKEAAKNVDEVVIHHSSKPKMSKNVAMSEEVQSEAQVEEEDLMKHMMSEKVSMPEEDESEAGEVPKEDVVKPKISEDVPMLEEGQGEAQDIPKDDHVELKMSDDSVMLLLKEVPCEAQE